MLDQILKLAADMTLPIEIVSAELAGQRMQICRACPRFNPEKETCTVCGCYMEVKTACYTNRNPKKMRNEYTHCPEGRWNDKELANHYRAIDGLEPLK